MFALSACNTFDLYQNIIQTNLNYSKQSKIEITSQIKNMPYAMQLAEYQNNQSILVLSNADKKYLSWVDGDNNILTTFNGKIVESTGLLNNIEIVNPPNLNNILNNLINDLSNKVKHSSLIRFSTPKTTYLELSLSYSFHSIDPIIFVKKINQNQIKVWLLREDFFVHTIDWKGSNFYWISENGEVVKSKQYIAPNLDRFYLETIKKYNN